MQEKDCSIIEGGINFAVFRYPKKKSLCNFLMVVYLKL